MTALLLSVVLALDPNFMAPPRSPPVARDVVIVVEAGALKNVQQHLWSIGRRLAPSDLRQRLRVGLVVYRAEGAPNVLPLTDDFDALNAALQAVVPGAVGGPAQLGEALRSAVADMPWRATTPRTRDVVVVGSSAVADLHVLKRALEAAAGNDAVVHWVSLGEGLTAASRLDGAGSRVTLEPTAVVPVPPTAHDTKLHRALLSVADTLVFAGPAEARAAADAEVARWKKAPPGELLERASFRVVNVPAAVPMFDVKQALVLPGDFDGAEDLPDAEWPEKLRRLTKAQRLARMKAAMTSLEERDARMRELAFARNAALALQKSDPVVDAVARAARSRW